MPSSVIKYMDYKAETHVLKIIFQTGAVYRYFDVPEAVYVGLRQARSKGRYFNKHISGVFPFERLSS
ncbi:KTSC domain-containing protein [Parapedobacter defluvii]|uniref:KTSC domain-containing protein n=1 Tax=Parapedobacter defluvii TaxID=2045106 RepID=A0ABQ1LLK0_9SPHI|nr:KTSC domain-containing protein [Parapedobacter defluvii]RQP16969.1 MAG: KTSC domain-containing protein [Parapedobacter sp.]GGC25114.1 KTSC domain-containing protein [Parapedobacter defluvii]